MIPFALKGRLEEYVEKYVNDPCAISVMEFCLEDLDTIFIIIIVISIRILSWLGIFILSIDRTLLIFRNIHCIERSLIWFNKYHF